jgi:hypothetical protein
MHVIDVDLARHGPGRRALNRPQETFQIAGNVISFQHGVQIEADHRVNQRIGRVDPPIVLISPGADAETGDGSQCRIAPPYVPNDLASIASANSFWEEGKILVEFLAYQLRVFETLLKTRTFYYTGDGWERVATVFQLPIKGRLLFPKAPLHEPLQQFFPVRQPTAYRYPSAEGQNKSFLPVGFFQLLPIPITWHGFSPLASFKAHCQITATLI